MSQSTPAEPSVLGSAFGLSWAGMGLGALVWLLLCPKFAGPENDREAARQYLTLLYGGSLAAMTLGTVAGATAGAMYARRCRRRTGGGA